ncbi:unnamed protein product [Phytophthora fragariaefolia]|uniref:Unnamed protein product n=1 Tax=Phytophthora fragariaefolia TaxID=1490495 RepID=A0A9W6Y599_9STRA|nr:unnamed protein product [Phytophthora fragariaefolia]
MPPAVRNWWGQQSRRDRQDWSRLSKLFKREYCKSKLSEAERYYTMTQHRFKPKRPDRAFVVQGDTELEPEGHELSDKSPEHRTGTPGNSFTQDDMDNGGPYSRADTVLTKKELIHEVFRVMERVGWPQRGSPPNPRAPAPRRPGSPPHSGYPPRVNPDRNEYCDECGRWGHRTEKCWSSMICDRCCRRGHPARICETQPGKRCEQLHEGRCEHWRVFQEIKKLVRQGGLSNLPNHVRDAILDGATPNGEADFEGQQLNH